MDYCRYKCLLVVLLGLRSSLAQAHPSPSLLQDNPAVIRLYSQFYWVDVIASTVFAMTFGILWYFVVDHTPVIKEEFAQSAASIPDSGNATGDITQDTFQTSLPLWKAESSIALIWLFVLWIIHVSGFSS